MTTRTVPPVAGSNRPHTVTIAAWLHFAVALAFLSIPLVGVSFGTEVQAAADAEVARQGQDPGVLAAHGLSFAEVGVALWAPALIAILIAATGVTVLAGRRWARILAWIVLPLLLVGNALIMASNAAAAQTLQSFFSSSGDTALHSLNAQALLDAAYGAYPAWLPVLENTRFAVVTCGCILGGVLLGLRPASAYFHSA